MINWLRTHPMNWDHNTLDYQTLIAEADSLQNHRRFLTARYFFSKTMGKAFAGQWVLHKVLRGDAQFALLASILHLHHRRDPLRPETGATTQNIIELFARATAHDPDSQLASRTRIKTMLTIVRYTGGVEVVPTSDCRHKPLVPTEKLIEPSRRWLQGFLRTVNLVLPLPPSALDVPFGLLAEVLSYNIIAYTEVGFMLHGRFPVIQRCMRKEAGYQILMFMIADMVTYPDGNGWTTAPIDQLASQLKLARGTVRNVLNDFAGENLIKIKRGGHHIHLSDRFVQLCNQWVALEFVWMYGLTRLAWERFSE
jgi:hypothetical protein